MKAEGGPERKSAGQHQGAVMKKGWRQLSFLPWRRFNRALAFQTGIKASQTVKSRSTKSAT